MPIVSSGMTTPATPDSSSIELMEPVVTQERLETTSSLEDLQTDEQREILDTVANVRKCGLDKKDKLEINVIPGPSRSPSEKAAIEKFKESITDFSDLPRVMDLAMAVMGIKKSLDTAGNTQAFSRDILSIAVEGPSRPQLTLVDIPGLIATHSKGTTAADVDLVAEITNHYISQPRTICLAVISATNDFNNQKILDRVRKVDPKGERTLGIITKPDGLPAGSDSESVYLELARNENIELHLGWHVLKNRKYEERDFSLLERNSSEIAFFRTSNFKNLPADCVGVESLRLRLSKLLFEHVRKELPKLRQDLDSALLSHKDQLANLGGSRSTVEECRNYLAELSLIYWETCKSAVNGHYEDEYFHQKIDHGSSIEISSNLRRARAVIQFFNMEFSDIIRISGYKYKINMQDDSESVVSGSNLESSESESEGLQTRQEWKGTPLTLNKKKAFDWVNKAMIRNRGKELPGNFNPLIVGELFWEQSSAWRQLAESHVERVAKICSQFLKALLEDKCPKDVQTRIWNFKIDGALKARKKSAMQELDLLMVDVRNHPINYNHYYTDTINKRRQDRVKETLRKSMEGASSQIHGYPNPSVDISKAITSFSAKTDPNLDNFGCQEALNCMLAIYKVQQKVFVANVTTQVIERHIVRGLEKIFSPVVVSGLSNSEAESIASESTPIKTHRKFLEDRIEKLEAGQEIFKAVM